MTETQTNNQIYHFSKKVLFLSILFLLINAAWYGLVTLQKEITYREVAPKLVFATGQNVLLKTPFDDDFVSAEPNQYLITGSEVKTDSSSYAEIRLEGNVIRLDNDTELVFLENNFLESDTPRFVFKLVAGNAWVNAFDPILIETPNVKARFAHTVGLYKYSNSLNSVYSAIGNVDLSLHDENGNPLTSFVVPLMNQVTFADSQLIQDYSRLQYSKLKKELKMFKISQSVLDEDWVVRNTKVDNGSYYVRDGYIYSPGSYSLHDFYYTYLGKISFIPSQKRFNDFYLARTKLKYILGGVNTDGDSAQADKILGEFDLLAEKLKGDSSFNELAEEQFYSIRNVKNDTPAYKVKEYLRLYLYARDKDPEIFRTYLADIGYLFRANELGNAEEIAYDWLEQWTDEVRQENSAEFNQQARIYHSLILAYADSVTSDFLAILDDIGDYRIKTAKDSEETLYEIATERLEVSKYLVANYRYTEAKTYLRTSYSKLNLSGQKTSAAAKELFVKDATLIAERIAFAEESLRGAATGIDEQKFRDYLSIQERDKTLTERFTTLLEEEAKVTAEEAAVYYPATADVSRRFTLSRIAALEQDIEIDSKNPFIFNIKTARLLDRAKDGSAITFTAYYDYSADAVYNIVLNGKALKGNFSLKDFVSLAKAGEEEAGAETTEITTLSDFLNLTEDEESRRSEIVAQDLAIQLLIKELNQYDILVPDSKLVTVLNQTTLAEFELTDVYAEDVLQKRSVQVSFKYDAANRIMSETTVTDKGELIISIQDKVKAEDFAQTIFTALYGKEQEAKAITETIDELDKMGLTLAKGDFEFTDAKMNQVDFKKIRMKVLPIEFSGVYDRTSKTFIRAEHQLWKTENIEVSQYITQLSELWAVDLLSQKGIEIGIANIETALPAEKIVIKNYARGDKALDFTFDTANNLLLNISLAGTEGKTDSMTFDEFALIGE